MNRRLFALLSLLFMASTLLPLRAFAQQKIVWTAQEQPIADQLHTLRSLSDDVRSRTHKDLAGKIRALPASDHKVTLATALASLSTEGDLGQDMLQEVGTTLEQSLREKPQKPDKKGAPSYSYTALAQLVRYEHVNARLDDPQYAAAMKQLEAEDHKREKADFSLSDLSGKKWKLSDLRGKVVLVNFWATWCPPCVKEMPDLQTLFDSYKDQGLVVLGISDEETGKVTPFLSQRNISYPVLLDHGRKVEERFGIDGIPKTFVYDRQGRLAAQSIDMRTLGQFRKMLESAGLK